MQLIDPTRAGYVKMHKTGRFYLAMVDDFPSGAMKTICTRTRKTMIKKLTDILMEDNQIIFKPRLVEAVRLDKKRLDRLEKAIYTSRHDDVVSWVKDAVRSYYRYFNKFPPGFQVISAKQAKDYTFSFSTYIHEKDRNYYLGWLGSKETLDDVFEPWMGSNYSYPPGILNEDLKVADPKKKVYAIYRGEEGEYLYNFKNDDLYPISIRLPKFYFQVVKKCDKLLTEVETKFKKFRDDEEEEDGEYTEDNDKEFFSKEKRRLDEIFTETSKRVQLNQ